ncbi:MAG: alpha/beta hydrolase, partial [Nocardioidaceae bacterium]
MRVVIVAVALVLLVLVAVWGLQRRLIYLPSGDAVPPATEVLPGARDVELRTSDGLRLGAWYLPATDPDLGVTVLVANGNAGDRAGRAPLARALAEQGLSVLLFDYRGYGGNPGDPTEDGLGLDVRAAREFLVDELGVRPDRLIYYGESLGTGVVVRLAADEPPAGLVLRSPFVDLAALGSFHYPYVPVR